MAPADLDRFLVTGGDGMIGRMVRFGNKTTRAELDVTSPAQVHAICNQTRPTGILHLAAADLRQCEADPFSAYRTNVLGTYQLALEAEERGIQLVFLSSGAVFSGAQGSVFDESCIPDPVNIYGQTKYLAEVLLNRMLKNALIVRTGWVFGGHGAHHRKFVDLAIDLAENGQPILANSDQQGSPTLVTDLLQEVQRLITSGATGIVHVVNSGVATAADMAATIVTTTGSRSSVRRVAPEQVESSGPKRSASEALTSRTVLLRPWQDALSEYVHEKKQFLAS